MSPDRSYLVCSTPRSGSTLVCQALAQSGVAGRPDEHFEALRHSGRPRRPEEYFTGVTDASILDHLTERGIGDEPAQRSPLWSRTAYDRCREWVFDAGTTDNGVFGAKLMWGYFGNFTSSIARLLEPPSSSSPTPSTTNGCAATARQSSPPSSTSPRRRPRCRDRGSGCLQPAHPVDESVVDRVLGHEGVERVDVAAGVIQGAWPGRVVGEEQAQVGAAFSRPLAHDWQEVTGVVGEQCPAVLHTVLEQDGIFELVPLDLDGGHDVVTAIAQTWGDRSGEVVVEGQLHTWAACSRSQRARSSISPSRAHAASASTSSWNST